MVSQQLPSVHDLPAGEASAPHNNLIGWWTAFLGPGPVADDGGGLALEPIGWFAHPQRPAQEVSKRSSTRWTHILLRKSAPKSYDDGGTFDKRDLCGLRALLP
jgi:hypothetical protein